MKLLLSRLIKLHFLGVGYAFSPPHSPQYDYNRVEILKTLLTAFSETLYLDQHGTIYFYKHNFFFNTCITIYQLLIKNRHLILQTNGLIIFVPVKIGIIKNKVK